MGVHATHTQIRILFSMVQVQIQSINFTLLYNHVSSFSLLKTDYLGGNIIATLMWVLALRSAKLQPPTYIFNYKAACADYKKKPSSCTLYRFS